MSAIYLIDGKPHQPCDCDESSETCKIGRKRLLMTCGFNRCMVPAPDVLIAGGVAVVSETARPEGETFLLEVCEALFGCHVSPGYDEDANRIFRCAVCDERIDIQNWWKAEHPRRCLINKVRDYLAEHKPECVPGYVSKPRAGTDHGADA